MSLSNSKEPELGASEGGLWGGGGSLRISQMRRVQELQQYRCVNKKTVLVVLKNKKTFNFLKSRLKSKLKKQ